MVGALAQLSMSSMHSTAKKHWQKRAHFAAYAGIQEGLAKLNSNAAWTGKIEDRTVPGTTDLVYTVEFDNNADGTEGRFANDGITWLPQGTVYLFSVAALGDREESGVAGFAALIGPQRPRFSYAVFANSNIHLDGSQVHEWDPTGVTGGSQDTAHVVTNMSAPDLPSFQYGIEHINGSSTHGQLRVGVGGSNALVNTSGSGNYAGFAVSEEHKTLTPFQEPLNVPPMYLPDEIKTIDDSTPNSDPNDSPGDPYTLRPGSYGTLNVNGSRTLRLRPNAEDGSVYVFQNLNMTSGTSIELETHPDHPVLVYIRQSATLNGVNVNTAGDPDPALLQFYFTGGGSNFVFNDSQGVFVAAGHGMFFQAQNSQVRGSVMGNRVRMLNSILHFDVRLRGVPLQGQGQFVLLDLVEVTHSVAVVALEEATAAAAATMGAPPPAPPAPVNPLPPNQDEEITGPAVSVVGGPAPCGTCGMANGHDPKCPENICGMCGEAGGGHDPGCPVLQCGECGQTGGSHAPGCSLARCAECNGGEGFHEQGCSQGEQQCLECGMTGGSHTVQCPNNLCGDCGRGGGDHDQTCPTLEAPCDRCGETGGNHQPGCAEEPCSECGGQNGNHQQNCSTQPCSACGQTGGTHDSSCTIGGIQCADCGVVGGGHTPECSNNPVEECHSCGQVDGAHSSGCVYYTCEYCQLTGTHIPECYYNYCSNGTPGCGANHQMDEHCY